jgi:hypothetical protein
MDKCVGDELSHHLAQGRELWRSVGFWRAFSKLAFMLHKHWSPLGGVVACELAKVGEGVTHSVIVIVRDGKVAK